MLLANVALPSFIGHWIIFTILLPLVAGIEAVVLRRALKTSLSESFASATAANWRSTLVGLPAGWCMAFVGLVPAGMLVAVLPPAYREPGFQIVAFTAFTGGVIPSEFSMIAMATGNLIILVPYYIASVRVERQVVETRHPEIEQARIASAVRSMNRITYAVLMLIVLCWLITAIKHYQDLVYLNDDFEGGETNFIVEPEVSIKPETGMGLMFQHPLLHEGAEVTSGVKYVARTDLMYRRPGVK